MASGIHQCRWLPPPLSRSPSLPEGGLCVVRACFCKKVYKFISKTNFVPHKKSKSTDSPTSHLIGWRATFEPSSGRRGDRDSGGRSPRYFRLALVTKRVLCVCARRLLPARALATSLSEGGLRVARFTRCFVQSFLLNTSVLNDYFFLKINLIGIINQKNII